MVNLSINGQEVSVAEGTTILDAAKNVQIKIPTLCHFRVDGIDYVNTDVSCMICVVELEGEGRLVPSCAARVEEGMVINTQSKKVIEKRVEVVRRLVAHHPSSCLQCEDTFHCELQKLTSDIRYEIKEGIEFDREDYEFEKLKDNPAIVRDPNKCIQCNRCKTMCNTVQKVGAIKDVDLGYIGDVDRTPLNETECIYCGQCVSVCPTGALMEVSNLNDVWRALKDEKKYVVVQTAPATRVALGEEFGMEAGHNVEGKMITALRRLGFDKVFDTNFSADLTTLEETNEFIERLEDGSNLPLMTSCCPGWVRHVEKEYPEFIDNLSTCKSPQGMLGSIIKNYFAEKEGLEPENIINVAIMPCIAKKYEASREELKEDYGPDIDYVLTTRELGHLIKTGNLDFVNLEDGKFDDVLGEYSGAGAIFGTSSGVIEAVARTAYEWVTEESLDPIDFKELRGKDLIKEATIDMDGTEINLGIVNGIGSIGPVLEDIKNGKSKYHAIEVMACPGGCIGGGGQPPHSGDLERLINERRKAIYKVDIDSDNRLSHKNIELQNLYDDYLGEPGSDLAHKLLHTTFKSKPVKMTPSQIAEKERIERLIREKQERDKNK